MLRFGFLLLVMDTLRSSCTAFLFFFVGGAAVFPHRPFLEFVSRNQKFRLDQEDETVE